MFHLPDCKHDYFCFYWIDARAKKVKNGLKKNLLSPKKPESIIQSFSTLRPTLKLFFLSVIQSNLIRSVASIFDAVNFFSKMSQDFFTSVKKLGCTWRAKKCLLVLRSASGPTGLYWNLKVRGPRVLRWLYSKNYCFSLDSKSLLRDLQA